MYKRQVKVSVSMEEWVDALTGETTSLNSLLALVMEKTLQQKDPLSKGIPVLIAFPEKEATQERLRRIALVLKEYVVMRVVVTVPPGTCTGMVPSLVMHNQVLVPVYGNTGSCFFMEDFNRKTFVHVTLYW